MIVDSGFDSGNIDVVAVDPGGEIRLRLRRDTLSEHAQWFHFRLSGGRGLTGSVANFSDGCKQASSRHDYAASPAKIWKAVSPLAGICPLRIM